MDNDNKLDKLTEALKGIKPAEFSWEQESDNHKSGFSVQEIQPLNTEQIDAILSNGTYLSGGSSQNYPYGNFTFSSTSALYNTGSSNTWNNTIGSSYPTTEVKGDLVVKGKNINNILDKIQDRLAILDEPNPEKLEKHAALKKAYDHYKLMEKLIGED
jgi:hypothetical protein